MANIKMSAFARLFLSTGDTNYSKAEIIALSGVPEVGKPRGKNVRIKLTDITAYIISILNEGSGMVFIVDSLPETPTPNDDGIYILKNGDDTISLYIIQEGVILGSADGNKVVNIWEGTNNPNGTPPPVFKIGDFYYQKNGLLKKIYQYNGTVWMESGTPTATSETGTAISLSNVLGSTDPSPTPYTDAVFTIKPDPVLLGWGTRLWSSAGKTEFATVTGATLMPTSPFEADKLYWINVVNRGDKIYYFFEGQEAGGGSGGVTTYAELTDKTTVDLPAINTPLGAALLLKADKLTTYTKTQVDDLLKNKQFAFIDNFPLEPTHNSATIFNDGKICTIDVNTRTYQDTFTVAAKNESDTVDGSIVIVGKTGWSYQLNDAGAVALTTGSNVTLTWTKGATCTIIKKTGTNKIFIDGGVE